jgi:septal ring factor EnvC (AmiA/AmiB activator)
MKKFALFILLSFAGVPAFAQWAVLDVANLKQSITNYTMMGEQLAKQGAQIANQVQQIQQFETQLKRLGDMSTIKKLVGFPQFRLDLNLPSKVKKWADGLAKVDGRALFGDTRAGMYPAIEAQFTDFDGARIDRDPQIYKEAQDLTASVDEFKAVQSDVYTRRDDLKQAIAETSDALQNADTEAEEQKLSAVLSAQYSQLSAVDSDVTLSAAEVQVKAAEATAMTNAQDEADAEGRRRLAQQEGKKLSTTFKPRYECLLQYVAERPMSP